MTAHKPSAHARQERLQQVPKPHAAACRFSEPATHLTSAECFRSRAAFTGSSCLSVHCSRPCVIVICPFISVVTCKYQSSGSHTQQALQLTLRTSRVPTTPTATPTSTRPPACMAEDFIRQRRGQMALMALRENLLCMQAAKLSDLQRSLPGPQDPKMKPSASRAPLEDSTKASRSRHVGLHATESTLMKQPKLCFGAHDTPAVAHNCIMALRARFAQFQ